MTKVKKVMSPDRYRTIADEFIHAMVEGNAEFAELGAYLDDQYGHDGWTDEDCEALDELIGSASVVVSWPDDYRHWISRCRCGAGVAVAEVRCWPTYEQARAELIGWRTGYGLEQVTHGQWLEEADLFFGEHRDGCTNKPAEVSGA